MTRNEFISGGLRILGAYFFIHGLLRAVDLIPVMANFGLLSWHDLPKYLFTIVYAVVSPVLYLALGWYLLHGGKWFYERATREHS